VNAYTNGPDTPENVNWQKFIYEFSATNILTTFAFISSTPLGNNLVGLDNVIVHDISMVPEPGSLPVLVAGFVAFVFADRMMARRVR